MIIFVILISLGLAQCVPLTQLENQDRNSLQLKNETEYERKLRILLENASEDINEDAKLDTGELLKKYGYPVEDYYVETEDGYILHMFRIPHNKEGVSNKGSVFLMHGLLESSADWLLLGPGKGLAYLLSDQGYDVWLGNARGNHYCRNHTTFTSDKSEFWQFSWHEIGYYDVPAMIDFLLATTGETKTFHIGHSQGTTSFYVMCSMRPEYNDKIKAHFSLAPIAFMNHLTSPLMQLAAFWSGPIELLLDLIGMDEFLPTDGFLASLSSALCSVNSLTEILCSNVLFALCGFDSKQMNITLVPVILAHVPAGSATKQLLHYSQEISSGHFRQYDFGIIGNMNIYGHSSPPNYDLKKITAPVYLHSSNNDWLAAQEDVEKLSEHLGNCQGKFIVSDNNFNHLDFLFAMNAPTILYPKIISLMSRH